MSLFRRNRDPDRAGSGTIIKKQRREHFCKLPNASEWPAGRWKIDGGNWVFGDLWRCDCGQLWKVAGDLWKEWEKEWRDQ